MAIGGTTYLRVRPSGRTDPDKLVAAAGLDPKSQREVQQAILREYMGECGISQDLAKPYSVVGDSRHTSAVAKHDQVKRGGRILAEKTSADPLSYVDRLTPGGRLTFLDAQFNPELVVEAAQSIMSTLTRLSPIRTGAYANSHAFILNYQEVVFAAKPPEPAEYTDVISIGSSPVKASNMLELTGFGRNNPARTTWDIEANKWRAKGLEVKYHYIQTPRGYPLIPGRELAHSIAVITVAHKGVVRSGKEFGRSSKTYKRHLSKLKRLRARTHKQLEKLERAGAPLII